MTEDDVFLATERAKAVLRTEQAVLAHWLERLTAAQSAERLGCSDSTVEYLRRHLQLTRARGGTQAQAIGRCREVTLVVEVRR